MGPKNLHLIRCPRQSLFTLVCENEGSVLLGWAWPVSPTQRPAPLLPRQEWGCSQSILGLGVLMRSGEVGKGGRRQEGEQEQSGRGCEQSINQSASLETEIVKACTSFTC